MRSLGIPQRDKFRARGLVPQRKAPPGDGAKGDGGACGTCNKPPVTFAGQHVRIGAAASTSPEVRREVRARERKVKQRVQVSAISANKVLGESKRFRVLTIASCDFVASALLLVLALVARAAHNHPRS